MQFQYDDGGRKEAGYRGKTSDCVVRAIAIALEKNYQEVYDAINVMAKDERASRRRKRSNSRTGVGRRTYHKYLEAEGWKFVPTMAIGSGCKVHLRPEELPAGRIIVRLSGHISAVVDGVVHDIYDPSREGTRCVYGYYRPGGG